MVQKWVMVLLLALALYDDPFYVGKNIGGLWYEECLCVFVASFIAMILFFWILIVHSIA